MNRVMRCNVFRINSNVIDVRYGMEFGIDDYKVCFVLV